MFVCVSRAVHFGERKISRHIIWISEFFTESWMDKWSHFPLLLLHWGQLSLMRCCVRRVSDKQVNLKHPDFIATSNGLYMHSVALHHISHRWVVQNKKGCNKTNCRGNWARFFYLCYRSATLGHMTHLRNKWKKMAQRPAYCHDVLHGIARSIYLTLSLVFQCRLELKRMQV